MMPNATPKIIFFSLHKLYLHSLFAFTGFLPVRIPHCKLLTLHLKTKHKLPAPISAPTSPSSHRAAYSQLCFSSLSAFVSQLLSPASLQLLFTPLISLSYMAFCRDSSHFLFLFSDFLLDFFLHFGVNVREMVDL